MVLIDSSPWIDLLSGHPTVEAQRLDAWLRNGLPVATTGIVLQEVLQGARAERDLNLLRARLGRLPFLHADKETHVDAARLYRKARERGWAIRGGRRAHRRDRARPWSRAADRRPQAFPGARTRLQAPPRRLSAPNRVRSPLSPNLPDPALARPPDRPAGAGARRPQPRHPRRAPPPEGPHPPR